MKIPTLILFKLLTDLLTKVTQVFNYQSGFLKLGGKSTVYGH